MVSKVFSCVCSDTGTHLVSVEADIRNGLPSFFLCGASNEVKESKERVRVAVENAGFFLQPKKITVNITPCGVKPAAGSLDLPIAVAVLTAYGMLPDDNEDCIFTGELSLEGELKPVANGPLLALLAKENGFKRIILPVLTGEKASIIKGIDVYGAGNLEQVLKILENNPEENALVPAGENFDFLNYKDVSIFDFDEIHCEEWVKRAIEAAAAGGLNIMFIGGDRNRAVGIMQCMKKLDAGLSDEQRIFLSEIGKEINNKERFEITHNGFMLVKDASSGNSKEYNKYYDIREKCRGVAAYASLCPCGAYPNTSKCLCSKQKTEAHIRKLNSKVLYETDMFLYLNETRFEEKGCFDVLSTEEMNSNIKKALEFRKKRSEKIVLSDDCMHFLCSFFDAYTYTEKLYDSLIRTARAFADLDLLENIEVENLKEAADLCVYTRKGENYD